MRLERYSDAEQVLRRAHELDPNSPTPLVNLGSAYSMEGDSLTRAGEAEAARDSYAKAVQVLAQATLLDPTSAPTSEYLGMALYRSGRFGASEQLLLRALELDPERHDARLSLVNVYTRLGNLESAVEHADLFFELHPDSPQTAALESILEEIDRVRSADHP